MSDWSDRSLATQRRACERAAQIHAMIAHELAVEHPDDLVVIVSSSGGRVVLETVELEPTKAQKLERTVERLVEKKEARRKARRLKLSGMEREEG